MSSAHPVRGPTRQQGAGPTCQAYFPQLSTPFPSRHYSCFLAARLFLFTHVHDFFNPKHPFPALLGNQQRRQPAAAATSSPARWPVARARRPAMRPSQLPLPPCSRPSVAPARGRSRALQCGPHVLPCAPASQRAANVARSGVSARVRGGFDAARGSQRTRQPAQLAQHGGHGALLGAIPWQHLGPSRSHRVALLVAARARR
jgi:hypothetical protein